MNPNIEHQVFNFVVLLLIYLASDYLRARPKLMELLYNGCSITVNKLFVEYSFYMFDIICLFLLEMFFILPIFG